MDRGNDGYLMSLQFLDLLMTFLAEPDLLTTYDKEAKGIPLGRLAEVHLRNNHAQYIFTWLVNI